MFKNYIKIAFRNLLRHKGYAFINITGLAIASPGDFSWQTFISIRIEFQDLQSTLSFIEKTWKKFIPNDAYEYFFIDESLDLLHREDQRFGDIFGYFAILAISISCMGLLGLVSFTTTQRTKEIGIRKVLGSSVAGILNLLIKEFLKLVLLANFIAWPLAWYAMNEWLKSFAYQIDMSWWMFATVGGIALLIALLTIGGQAIRAALANPIDSLRYE